jgi:hypothetical protein
MSDPQIGLKSGNGPEDSLEHREWKLPRRDWVLLPLLALLTAFLLLLSMKSVANRTFATSGNLQKDCISFKDAARGAHGIPNTTCWDKLSETKRIDYTFNNCGDLAGFPCGPKPPGTYRIVMTGSSFVFGLGVPRDKTFAALLPAELSQITGRTIELYNEGLLFKHPHVVDVNFDEILAQKPDLILWVLTPYDVEEASTLLPPRTHKPAGAPGAEAGFLGRVKYNVRSSFAGKSFPEGARALWNKEFAQFSGGLTAVMLQHYLYKSQSQYVKAYLMGGEGNRDTAFLMTDPTATWQNNVKAFDGYLGSIEDQAKAAGVPFVGVMVPQRGQAAMISMGHWPSGFDPYKLDNEMRSTVVSHGGTYLDILQDFKTVPNPEQYYLPVDGHPDADGHAMISAFLAKALTSGAIPALRADTQTQTAQARGK